MPVSQLEQRAGKTQNEGEKGGRGRSTKCYRCYLTLDLGGKKIPGNLPVMCKYQKIAS
jgi:hypothetical protein